MNEKELVETYQIVYRTAFDANNYYQLIIHYSEIIPDNREIIHFAPAFWGITRSALGYACLMQVAKLYDESPKSISIKDLFSKESFAYLSQLEPNRHIMKLNLYKLLDISIAEDDYSKYSDLYCKDIFKVLNKEKKKIKEHIELLKVYRNRGYAHNDISKIQSPDDIEQIPTLEKEAMKKLIDFALNTCRVILYLRTGRYGATEYQNINDVYGAIQLMQFGMYEQKKMVDCWKKGINYHPPTVYESGD